MQNCACEVDECALCGAEFYSALTVEQACQIRELLAKKTRKPRTILFRQGEPDSLLFMLRVLERNPESALRVIDSLNQELQRAQALIRDLGAEKRPRATSLLFAVAQAAPRPA